jgi:ubiquinone/menaquinone biosynthesis C-methylase UbiE
VGVTIKLLMKPTSNAGLTDRQRREVEYHREHAEKHRRVLATPFVWGVLQNPARRWWNAYWSMYAYLVQCDLKGKRVLVVGCGLGEDALRIAKLGAKVSAFDLSPDSLGIARELAARERLQIAFDEMPAEKMRYEDSTFDYIVARDIFHHVDIPLTMSEIVRVAKPGAVCVVNEIYSHSMTEKVRRSWLVESILYPRMRGLIYGPDQPYITKDERKLDEHDLEEITKRLQPRQFEKHFNFLIARVLPYDRFEILARVDQLLLRLLKPIGRLLAGRVLFSARVSK